MRNTLLLLFPFTINLCLAQNVDLKYATKPDNLSGLQRELRDTSQYDFGFGRFNLQAASPVVQLDNTQFNQGNISDPLQLIQGRLSGLLVARAGNDPNEGFASRIRGISSLYMSSSPLILIDGMPASSLLNVDPFDVQKVTMVKDAASASAFGLRSLGGVLLFDTYRGEKQKLTVRHYTSFETPNDESQQVLGAKEYVATGGNNVGSETNWHKEITRQALSNATHISYGDKKGDTEYYASVNYRTTDGVLKNSRFTNLNGRFRLKQNFFDNRLALGFQLSLTHRESMFSFAEAFKYSKIYNPTAPVFNPTGGYSEALLFDYHNPLAMVQQNMNDGTLNIANFGVNATWNVSPSFQIKGAWTTEWQKNEIKRYWTKQSRWVGLSSNGLRDQDVQSLNTSFGYLSALYTKQVKATIVNILASYTSQGFDASKDFVEAGNFVNDEMGKASVYNSLNFSNGIGIKTFDFKESKTINSFRASFSSNTKDILYFSANLCSENIGPLSGTTLGLSTGVDLASKGTVALTLLKPRVGYGASSGALSFFQNYSPQNILQSWRLLSGALSPESKSEFNVGVDWGIDKNKLSGSFNYFTAATTNAVAPSFIFSPGSVRSILSNNSQIENKGIEVDINWSIMEREGVSISTSLNFSTVENIFRTSQVGGYSYSAPEFVIGNTNSLEINLTDGSPIGQIKGFTYQGIANKDWVFLDVDKNGSYDSRDQTTFSKPLPSSFVGWSMAVKAGRLKATMFLRGAFGHTLFSAYRLGYENPQFINNYNVPRTVLNADLKTLQQSNEVSNFYSENASYLKLDNISVFYDFYLLRDRRVMLTAFVTAQNLFTISNYQGNNPEVRLGYNESQMIAGFDSQFTYTSSKTYLAGIQLKL
jgi:TonB-dependent starch-binding outer membrane protein SusC